MLTTSVCESGIYVNSDVSMQTYMSMPGMCPADSLYYASCTAFVSRWYQQYYCCWSSWWCCCTWTMATRRSPVYLATSSTDYRPTVCDERRCTTCLLCSLHGSTNTSPCYSVTFSGCGCQSGYSLNSLCSSFDACTVQLCHTWWVSYVVWRMWIQERGCDLRRRLPLSHHLCVVRQWRSWVLRCTAHLEHFAIQPHCIWDTQHLQASPENASYLPHVFL